MGCGRKQVFKLLVAFGEEGNLRNHRLLSLILCSGNIMEHILLDSIFSDKKDQEVTRNIQLKFTTSPFMTKLLSLWIRLTSGWHLTPSPTGPSSNSRETSGWINGLLGGLKMSSITSPSSRDQRLDAWVAGCNAQSTPEIIDILSQISSTSLMAQIIADSVRSVNLWATLMSGEWLGQKQQTDYRDSLPNLSLETAETLED